MCEIINKDVSDIMDKYGIQGVLDAIAEVCDSIASDESIEGLPNDWWGHAAESIRIAESSIAAW